MGLFDKLLGSQGSDLILFDKRDAFTAVLLAVVASDGDVSSEEAEEIVAVSNRLQLYKGQSADQFNVMVNKLIGFLNRNGVNALLEKACQALPGDLRETAFAVAADLIFADGTVEPKEQEMIERLQAKLDLSPALATKIVEVLIIKNRG